MQPPTPLQFEAALACATPVVLRDRRICIITRLSFRRFIYYTRRWLHTYVAIGHIRIRNVNSVAWCVWCGVWRGLCNAATVASYNTPSPSSSPHLSFYLLLVTSGKNMNVSRLLLCTRCLWWTPVGGGCYVPAFDMIPALESTAVLVAKKRKGIGIQEGTTFRTRQSLHCVSGQIRSALCLADTALERERESR